MDWNGNLRPSFVSRPETSFNFLYNYNCDHYQGLEMKYPVAAQASSQAVVITGLEKNNNNENYHHHHNHHQEEKKKRLTSEQLESLESSFQEEIKLDADRKGKLARELGLQPRQVAVWFQNRRARWKAKQLERLYDSLKQEFDVVSREKQKLQQEVLALKSLLKEEQPTKNQFSTGYTEISGEETAESASVGNRSSSRASHKQMAVEANCVLSVDEYNTVMPPYWGTVLPPSSYP